MNHPGTNQKFRPYLTLAEMTEVIDSLKSTPNPNGRLIYYFQSFIDKIYVGKVSSTITTRPTMEQSLELEPLPQAKLDLREQRLQAYNKWLASPARCTIQELTRAQMYRYENDLMSEEEETQYELKLERGY